MEESKESSTETQDGRQETVYNEFYLLYHFRRDFSLCDEAVCSHVFPFILGLAVAAVLSPLIGKLCEKTGKRALVSIVVLGILWAAGAGGSVFPRAMSVLPLFRTWPEKLPQFYVEVIEPELGILFERIVVSFPEYQDWVSQMSASLENALQSGIMTVSGHSIGWGGSWIVGFPAILGTDDIYDYRPFSSPIMTDLGLCFAAVLKRSRGRLRRLRRGERRSGRFSGSMPL